MRFKSEAQRNKFKQLVADGKITQEIFDAMDGETDRKRLLPRVPEKPQKTPRVKYAKVAKVLK